jgi:hypothetical protein
MRQLRSLGGKIIVWLGVALVIGFPAYFVLKYAVGVSFLNSRGPDACKVLTPAIAQGVLGGSAQLGTRTQLNAQETLCSYTDRTDRFVSVTVGDWDTIKGSAPSSGQSNQGVGAGTYLRNAGVETDSTIAKGSSVGRVAQKGDVGIDVQAGHYGQFFGEAAVRELAFEDQLERKLVLELLPRA